MKNIYKGLLLASGISLFTLITLASATSLGSATNFAILGSTYTNTVSGTTVNGKVGYTTPPVVSPTVNGVVHIADGDYTQAGIDQGVALGVLNSQPCDFNHPSPTDLSLLPQPLVPGVYCMVGDVSIGTGGIQLIGDYIFRIDGALTTAANSQVSGSACNIFWTPTHATTLGANSKFIGTVIDNAGITVGSTVTWEGRALAFGGTVTTDTDTISVPVCSTSVPTSTELPQLTIPKLPNTGIHD